MDSTFITCLFNLRRKEKENDTHETSVNLQSQRETHYQNIEPHGSQRVLQTLVYSFAKSRDEMYNEAQSNPKCPTLKMTEKIQDIDKPNSSPCLYGSSSLV